MKKVPAFIAETYARGSHGFRAEKRQQARKARKLLHELRVGCAHFPNGSKDVEIAINAIDRIIKDISSRNWGR